MKCQSCMMPLKKDEDYGLEKDGTKSIYCHHCYKDGKFSTPDLTCEEMKAFCIDLMKKEFKVPKFIGKLMYANLHKLERWSK